MDGRVALTLLVNPAVEMVVLSHDGHDVLCVVSRRMAQPDDMSRLVQGDVAEISLTGSRRHIAVESDIGPIGVVIENQNSA